MERSESRTEKKSRRAAALSNDTKESWKLNGGRPAGSQPRKRPTEDGDEEGHDSEAVSIYSRGKGRKEELGRKYQSTSRPDSGQSSSSE